MQKYAHNLSIIIVNFNSVAEITRCLSDIASLPHAHALEIIIVNNDPTHLKITFKNLSVKVIEINENIGYGKANNRGFLHASRPYICFLNPDTYTFSDNFLSMIDHIADMRTIASPRILDDNATIQKWSCGNTVSLSSIILSNIGIFKKPWLSDTIIQTPWVSGTSLFISRDLFQTLNGFDEDYFLYFEDVDLCKRAEDLHGKTLLIPHITLKHASGSSSKKARKFQKKCYYRSQDIFITKHFSAFHAYILRILRFFHSS